MKVRITACTFDQPFRIGRRAHVGQVGTLLPGGDVQLDNQGLCSGSYEPEHPIHADGDGDAEVPSEHPLDNLIDTLTAYKERVYKEAKRIADEQNWCKAGFRRSMSNLDINVDDFTPKYKWTIEVESDGDLGVVLAVGSQLCLAGGAGATVTAAVTRVSELSWDDDIRQELAATADGG